MITMLVLVYVQETSNYGGWEQSRESRLSLEGTEKGRARRTHRAAASSIEFKSVLVLVVVWDKPNASLKHLVHRLFWERWLLGKPLAASLANTELRFREPESQRGQSGTRMKPKADSISPLFLILNGKIIFVAQLVCAQNIWKHSWTFCAPSIEQSMEQLNYYQLILSKWVREFNCAANCSA